MKETLYEKRNNNYSLSPEKLLVELKEKEKELTSLIEQCNESIKDKPLGKLKITKNKSGVHYYYRTDEKDKNGKYIHKTDEALAWELAQKCYDEKLREEAEIEIKLIREMLKRYNPEKIQSIWQSMNVKRKSIIANHILTDEEYAQKWSTRQFEQKVFDENDETEFYTSKGERVRSKSEVMIADALSRYNIPYIYEYPIEVRGYSKPLHPDFICLNVKNRKEIVWEHLGMMGKEEYADANVRKIEKYMQSGYYQGDNLIVTMETVNVPLSTRTIEEMIKKYL